MREKQEIPVYNRADDIVHGYRKTCFGKTTPLQLQQFLGHSVDNKGFIDKRVNKNHEYYVVENWTAINLNTHKIGNYVIPFVLGHKYDNVIDLTTESSLLDRKEGDFPNDELEVNLLTDSYEEYLNNQRDNTPNFHLMIVNAKHKLRMARLKYLISVENSPKMKQGYLYHYIQKETPSLIGKRKYEEWCNTNPLLLTRLINNVYQTNDTILS